MITFILSFYFSLYISALYIVCSIIYTIKKIDLHSYNVVTSPLMLKLFLFGALITIFYAPLFVYRGLFVKNYVHFVALNIYITTMEEQ